MNAFTPIVPLVEVGNVDLKLAFLARAAVRFELVEAGEMDIDEAFEGLVVCPSCGCDRRPAPCQRGTGGPTIHDAPARRWRFRLRRLHNIAWREERGAESPLKLPFKYLQYLNFKRCERYCGDGYRLIGIRSTDRACPHLG
jgi:hypothetical protein